MAQPLLWPHTDVTPYEVLGVSTDATVGEVRRRFKQMALQTHPDKVHVSPQSNSHHASSGGAEPAAVGAATYSFLLVRAAAEVLLDPHQRALYDQQRSQAMIRGCGACSDSYTLSEDFEAVPLTGEVSDEPTGVELFQRECRCGGVYEVVLFAHDRSHTEASGRTVHCECDCCSLVVEVAIDV